MKVNFKELKLYGDIERKTYVVMDVRLQLANAIYRGIPGIVAHVLAERIYKSDGEMEISEEEKAVLEEVKSMVVPAFADSISEVLNHKTEEE